MDMESGTRSCLKYLRMTGARVCVISRSYSFFSAVVEVSNVLMMVCRLASTACSLLRFCQIMA